MTQKFYCYQFSEQKVFAPENAPICFQIKNDLIIVAMDNYTVALYDVNDGNFNLINTVPVCGFVLKIDYCFLDDYIITLESKDNNDGLSGNNSVRTYHNWRKSITRPKMRFRPALATKNYLGQNSNESELFLHSSESVIDVLEFLHLTQPLCFAIYTNSHNRRSFTNKNQYFEDLSSIVGVSENTYIHMYRLSIHRPSGSLKHSKAQTSSDLDNFFVSDSVLCFQHLYTVNFSFIVHHINMFSHIIAAASVDKVQVIRILEEKQKFEKYSSKFENTRNFSSATIEIDIEKCWLASISNARKLNATNPKARPREILGPTQDLDTASITLLRYPDSKQMSFETLLFRKYYKNSPSSHIKDINLVRVSGFDECGLFIMREKEIVQYSFCLKRSEFMKVAEYDFKGEVAVGMAFSDHVNLLHVAFTNGDLITYNSWLCSIELFETSSIVKKVSLSKLNKVTLMGLTDVKTSGNLVLAFCKFNLDNLSSGLTSNRSHDSSDTASLLNYEYRSSDSWNFYLFKQPPKSELKENIINHAEYKGSKKLLQMLLCSLLAYPNKEEMTYDMIENIIVCCLKTETVYSAAVPHFLLRDCLSISAALSIFQTLETKELFENKLFKIYAKNRLIKTNLSDLTEDQFRWIVMKMFNCSLELLFDVLVSNKLEDFLKIDLLVIESITTDTFESFFIKILYYSAHNEYELVQPLIVQLDENEVHRICSSNPHLIYYNKNHTSFGWMLNLHAPQLYAKIIATCFLNECSETVEFRNLEITKQVGQCSYILTLEEVLYILLQQKGIFQLKDTQHINSRGQYQRRHDKTALLAGTKLNRSMAVTTTASVSQVSLSSAETSAGTVPNVNRGNFDNVDFTTDSTNNHGSSGHAKGLESDSVHKYYINQLIMLYHEFSFNGVEFCPHKEKKNCKIVPSWLKNLRYHTLLNLFPPFNRNDPFNVPHILAEGLVCPGLCCQSYLVRLQSLLSWKEAADVPNIKIVSSSCDANDHPAWKSLYFLLLQAKPAKIRDPVEIVKFLSTISDKTVQRKEPLSNTGFVDIYLNQFGNSITAAHWEKLIPVFITVPTIHGTITAIEAILRYACRSLSLPHFLALINTLYQSNLIDSDVSLDWIERAGRLANRDIVFNESIQKLVNDANNT